MSKIYGVALAKEGEPVSGVAVELTGPDGPPEPGISVGRAPEVEAKDPSRSPRERTRSPVAKYSLAP